MVFKWNAENLKVILSLENEVFIDKAKPLTWDGILNKKM
jgi:hypothetical protein